MNARAQQARQNKKRINSFGLTSQREIASQKGYISNFNRQSAILRRVPLFDTRLRNQDDLKCKCSQKTDCSTRDALQFIFRAHVHPGYGSTVIHVAKVQTTTKILGLSEKLQVLATHKKKQGGLTHGPLAHL